MQTSGAMRRENAVSYSVVIVREGGRSSIPETYTIEPISRGVLDTRLRGYDDLVLAMTGMGRSAPNTLHTRDMRTLWRRAEFARLCSAIGDTNAGHAHVKGHFRPQIDND